MDHRQLSIACSATVKAIKALSERISTFDSHVLLARDGRAGVKTELAALSDSVAALRHNAKRRQIHNEAISLIEYVLNQITSRTTEMFCVLANSKTSVWEWISHQGMATNRRCLEAYTSVLCFVKCANDLSTVDSHNQSMYFSSRPLNLQHRDALLNLLLDQFNSVKEHARRLRLTKKPDVVLDQFLQASIIYIESARTQKRNCDLGDLLARRVAASSRYNERLTTISGLYHSQDRLEIEEDAVSKNPRVTQVKPPNPKPGHSLVSRSPFRSNKFTTVPADLAHVESDNLQMTDKMVSKVLRGEAALFLDLTEQDLFPYLTEEPPVELPPVVRRPEHRRKSSAALPDVPRIIPFSSPICIHDPQDWAESAIDDTEETLNSSPIEARILPVSEFSRPTSINAFGSGALIVGPQSWSPNHYQSRHRFEGPASSPLEVARSSIIATSSCNKVSRRSLWLALNCFKGSVSGHATRTSDVSSNILPFCLPWHPSSLFRNKIGTSKRTGAGNQDQHRLDTELVAAVLRNDNRGVWKLIQKGADVNTPRQSYRPLSFACTKGRSAMIKLLIKAGAHPDGLASDGQKASSSPLTDACCRKDLKVAKILISAGASADFETGNGMTPLAIASQAEDEAMVDLLLTRGTTSELSKSNALGLAVQLDRKDIVSKLLAENADINLPNNRGEVPIVMASKLNKCDMLEFLISNHAGPNHPDRENNTALSVAISNNDEDIVSILINAGAIVDQVDRKGCSMLVLATQKSLGMTKMILDAAANPNFPSHCPDVSVYDGRLYPLMFAFLRRDIDMMQLLIKYGADVNCRHRGRTMINLAAEGNDKEMVRLLITHKARHDHVMLSRFLATSGTNSSQEQSRTTSAASRRSAFRDGLARIISIKGPTGSNRLTDRTTPAAE